MERRGFLKSLAAASCICLGRSGNTGSRPVALNTVLGKVTADQLGPTLMHEHVLVDFIGAEQASRSRYNPNEVFAIALPHLKRLYEAGCRTLVECTPAYIGRDPGLLASLSEASKLNLITNTGYYGAANDKFIPAFAYKENVAQLANRWVKEFEKGIAETRVKPGIIKIGVDAGTLSEVDAKLVQAAALTHLQTGLTIASHTGDGIAALEQLALLKKLGVRPDAFIWVHAQNEANLEVLFQAAQQGCWVEFDGISPSSLENHLKIVERMAGGGYLPQTLISQDAGWYHVGEPNGGEFRGFEFLFTTFLPELRKSFSDLDIEQLIVHNPGRALTPPMRSMRQRHE